MTYEMKFQIDFTGINRKHSSTKKKAFSEKKFFEAVICKYSNHAYLILGTNTPFPDAVTNKDYRIQLCWGKKQYFY